nr:hypothetical protein [uncultured Acetatifactor sp.]
MNASVQGKKKNTVLHRIKKYRILYLLAIIPFAYLIVFRYWPIFLQFVLATKNYTIKGGTEQILLFYSPTNYEVSDVIGTWLYRQGLGKLKYGLGAAVSVFESSVGLVLVLVSNKLANKFAGLGIW